MADLISQADLENRIGSETFARFTDDDGDGLADPAVVAKILDDASRRAEGLVLGSWGIETFANIVANDPAVRGFVEEIAIGLTGERRQEFLDQNGNSPYSHWLTRGEKALQELAQGKRRSAAEPTQGRNQALSTSISPDRESHIFAANNANKVGPGGF